MAWDQTDKEEVDLVNKGIEVSLTPIHALDVTYDATRKLLNYIERQAAQGTRYDCQIGKMQLILENYRDLVDKIEKIDFREYD